MTAFRLLWREMRGGQLGLIVAALVLAVAVVSGVALLAERIERALTGESKNLLGADLQVRSSRDIPEQWIAQAHRMGVKTVLSASFGSMVFHGDELHLASVKAVENGYPLRGAIKVSDRAFATRADQIDTVAEAPPTGEVWVDSRLLPLLDIRVGDSIEVGDATLRVSRIVIEEPDRGGSFSLFGARVLMNWADLPAAGVIQPGSRVDYRLLLSAPETKLQAYLGWLRPKLTEHQQLVFPDEAQARLSDTLRRGREFLLLAGSIGVSLAGVALALASARYAATQRLQVALIKSWGLSRKRVRNLYIQQLLWLGIVGGLVGLALGYAIQAALIAAVRELLPVSLPAAGAEPLLLGLATGLLCLLGFALPALWHLPAQSPLSVIRSELLQPALGLGLRAVLGGTVIVALLYGYCRDLRLTAVLVGGFTLTAVLCGGLGYGLLKVGNRSGARAGSSWRLALANLWRRRFQSLTQMTGFAIAIALLLILVAIRTSLVEEWRWQLEPEAPNHFLVNVAPYELEGVRQLIEARRLKTAGWYSMVRGRLVGINGAPPSDEMKERHNALQRELNLSWSDKLPEGNKIVEGLWWEAAPPNGGVAVPVSVEADLLKELGLHLGDRLTFSIGGLTFESEIASVRTLKWDSMTPNFYFLFPEGVLEQYPRTFMTSLFVPPEHKLLVNELLKAYPTIQIIELDKVIARIRNIVEQVTRGLELMTMLILACGVLVILAAVGLSMRERLQESALLRALGSSRRQIMGIQLIEFSASGVFAGLIAALAAEMAVVYMQSRIFQLPVVLHGWLWLAGPLSGGLLVAALGAIQSRHALVQPPLRLLQDFG